MGVQVQSDLISYITNTGLNLGFNCASPFMTKLYRQYLYHSFSDKSHFDKHFINYNSLGANQTSPLSDLSPHSGNMREAYNNGQIAGSQRERWPIGGVTEWQLITFWDLAYGQQVIQMRCRHTNMQRPPLINNNDGHNKPCLTHAPELRHILKRHVYVKSKILWGTRNSYDIRCGHTQMTESCGTNMQRPSH